MESYNLDSLNQSLEKKETVSRYISIFIIRVCKRVIALITVAKLFISIDLRTDLGINTTFKASTSRTFH